MNGYKITLKKRRNAIFYARESRCRRTPSSFKYALARRSQIFIYRSRSFPSFSHRKDDGCTSKNDISARPHFYAAGRLLFVNGDMSFAVVIEARNCLHEQGIAAFSKRNNNRIAGDFVFASGNFNGTPTAVCVRLSEFAIPDYHTAHVSLNLPPPRECGILPAMKCTSTRNRGLEVSAAHAVLHSLPADGGLYVPLKTEDLRKWLLYTDEDTTFSSIAGALTSAFISDEFSPIVCEAIASRAFRFAPALRQLDELLFLLELTHGPTGMQHDFGIAYLASMAETVMHLQGETAVFLDVSAGAHGASLASAVRGKKHVKAVIVSPRGTLCGIRESDLIWNGGAVFPVEVDGTLADCFDTVRPLFSDTKFIAARNIILSNTVNIGSLMADAFFYPFAFSRIKNKIHSDIYYALSPDDYSSVVAGLYSWQSALPLNGFILPATDALSVNISGAPVLLDTLVPLAKRPPADPLEPSNLERLEAVFSANALMMRHFIYPVALDEHDVLTAAKELFIKHKIYADRHTARAYAALQRYLKNGHADDSAAVLLSRAHPALSGEYIRRTVGEQPEMPDAIKAAFEPTCLTRPCIQTADELRKIIEQL